MGLCGVEDAIPNLLSSFLLCTVTWPTLVDRPPECNDSCFIFVSQGQSKNAQVDFHGATTMSRHHVLEATSLYSRPFIMDYLFWI
jgi:hypothetical protein